VLDRNIYRGVVTWNRTRKRNQWGQTAQSARPAGEWVERPAPHLQIVSDELWNAAHRRLDAVRGLYLKTTNGQRFGRPPLGDPSKYLLTNFARCRCCGCTLYVVSRSHGKSRTRFYGCSGYHERGICDNRRDLPMADADDKVIEALLDDVIDPAIVNDAVEAAVTLLRQPEPIDRVAAVEAEIAGLERDATA
jgi:hypothetical protein